MHSRRPVMALVCLLALVGGGAAGASERFTGSVVDVGGAVRATSARFTLQIDEYSDLEEIRTLLGVLAEQGPGGLEKAMRKLDRGWFRVGAELGYPVSVARSIETEGGRVVRAVVDRPIQMFEVMRGLRSADYPFGIIEIKLDANGKGEGRLIAAAKVEFNDEGAVEIESLGTQPFRLMQVRLREE